MTMRMRDDGKRTTHRMASAIRQGPARAQSGRGEEEMSAMKLLLVGADGQLGIDMTRLPVSVSAVTALAFHDQDIMDSWPIITCTATDALDATPRVLRSICDEWRMSLLKERQP